MEILQKQEIKKNNSDRLLLIARIICIIAIIGWMGVIFAFSAQSSFESQGASDQVMMLLEKVIYFFTGKQLSMSVSPENYQFVEIFVRKLAHMFIFFILCISSMLFMFTFKIGMWKRIFISMAFCFTYACIDEYHQMYVDGRGASFIDSLIDTSGAAIGIIAALVIYCIVYTIYHTHQNKKQLKNTTKEA